MREYIVREYTWIQVGMNDLVMLADADHLEDGGRFILVNREMDPYWGSTTAYYNRGAQPRRSAADFNNANPLAIIGGNFLFPDADGNTPINHITGDDGIPRGNIFISVGNLQTGSERFDDGAAGLLFRNNGTVQFAAQTGTKGPLGVDTDILISVRNWFISPMEEFYTEWEEQEDANGNKIMVPIEVENPFFLGENYNFSYDDAINSEQVVKSWGIVADKVLTVIGDLASRFNIVSLDNKFTYWRYRLPGETEVTYVDISAGNTVEVLGVEAAQIVVQHHVTGTVNLYLSAVSENYGAEAGSSGNVELNIFAATAYRATGYYNDATKENIRSCFLVHGYLSNRININVSAIDFNATIENNHPADPEEGEDPEPVNGVMSINHNLFRAVGIEAQYAIAPEGEDMNGNTIENYSSIELLGGFDGEMLLDVAGINITALSMPVADDSVRVSIVGNTFLAIGMEAHHIYINEMTGLIQVSVGASLIDPMSNGGRYTCSGNILRSYGLRAGSVAASTHSTLTDAPVIYHDNSGTILANSLGGSIVIQNGGHITNGRYDGDVSTTIQSFGIYAEKSVEVSGMFSTGIYIVCGGYTTFSNDTTSMGISTIDLRIGGAMSADIVIESAVNDQGWGDSIYSRVIAVDVNRWENGYTYSFGGKTFKDAVDFTGSISVGVYDSNGVASYDGAAVVGIQIKYDANIRISGDIHALSYISGDVYLQSYAVVAGAYFDYAGYSYRTSSDDIIELAAGANVVGKILVANGTDRVIIDSNARFTGIIEADLSRLNVEFRLNENCMSGITAEGDAIFKTYWDGDSLLHSTTTISVNINDADVGKEYTLLNILNISSEDWYARDITVTYQGYTGVFTIGTNGNTNSNTFTQKDGAFTVTTAVVGENITFVINDRKDVVVQAGTLNKEKYDFEKGTITLSWNSKNRQSDIAAFEVEYRVLTDIYDENGIFVRTDVGNSVVTFVDRGERELVFDFLTPGTRVEWRVREHIGDFNSVVSDWTQSAIFTVQKDALKLDAPDNNHVEIDDSPAGATAIVKWDDVIASETIEYYEVRYTQNNSPDAVNFSDSSLTVIYKYTTAPQIMLSALNNTQFLHWEVRAKDRDGNYSAWAPGDVFQVYVDDIVAPEFDMRSVVANVSFNGSAPKEEQMIVTMSWAPANNVGNKSELAGYDVSYRLLDPETGEGVGEWHTVRVSGKSTGTTLKLANGTYEWKVAVSDYAGNRSQEYIGNIPWEGDVTPPSFDDISMTVTTEKIGTDNFNITLSWSPASDSNNSLNPGSGIDKYVLYYRPLYGSDDLVVKVEVKASDKPQYTLNNIANKLDGEYVWWVEAYDAVGNISVSSDSYFLIDTKAPVGGIDGMTEGIRFTADFEIVQSSDRYGNPIQVVTPSNVVGTINLPITIMAPDPSGVFVKFQFCKDGYYNNNVSEYYFEVPVDPETGLFNGWVDFTFNDEFWTGAGGIAKWEKVYGRMCLVDGLGNSTNSYMSVWQGQPFTVVATDNGTGQLLPLLESEFDVPSKVFNESVQVYYGNNNITLSWGESLDTFGICSYELLFSKSQSAKGSSYVYDLRDDLVVTVDAQWGHRVSYTVDPKELAAAGKIAEGEYYIFVRAHDWYGNKSELDTFENTSGSTLWLEPIKVIIDYTKPVMSTSSINVATFGNTYTITWGAATENVGVDHYELLISRWNEEYGGYLQWFSESFYDLKKLVYEQNNQPSGTYAFQIRAIDKAGNVSDWTGMQTFTLDTKSDPGSNMSTARKVEWGESYSGSIGASNSTDYLRFDLDSSGSANITISVNEVAGYKSGTKIQVVNSAGKAISSFSLSKGTKSLNLLLNKLESGSYYVVVNSNSNSNRNTYNVVGNINYFPGATPNNSFATAETVTLNPSGGGSFSGWVGFGDAADYYVLDSAAAGTMSISITDVSASLKLTVYDVNGKSLKSVSVKGNSNFAISNLLVPQGAYITVTSGDNGKGKQNSNYSVSIVQNYFQPATPNSSFDTAFNITVTDGQFGYGNDAWVGYGDAIDYYYVSSDGAGALDFLKISHLSGSVTVTIYDENKKRIKSVKASSNGQLFSNMLLQGNFYITVESGDKGKGKQNTYYELSGFIDYFPAATPNNSFATAEVINPDEFGDVTFGGWVGYGDANDYYMVDAVAAGSVTISIADVTAKLTVTVYDANQKKLKSVNISNSGTLFTNLLVPNGAYIVVSSGDKGKGVQNSDYSISFNADYFPTPTPNNNFATAAVVALDENGYGTAAGWVGYGDAVDYYVLDSTSNGSLNLSVSGVTSKVAVTLYDASGKKVASVSLSGSASNIFGNRLVGEGYYVVVESGDKGKGAQNSGYELIVNQSYFPVPTNNNTISTATNVALSTTGEGVVDSWVGYGDAIDYYRLSYGANGTLNLSLSGVSSKVNVTLYDANGKKLATASLSGSASNIFSDYLVSGASYVSIESGDKGKGGQNTSYSLVVNADYFPTPTNNNSFDTATTIAIEPGSLSLSSWVGYGDAADYYRFAVDGIDGLTVTVGEAGCNMSVTVYDYSGKVLSSGKIDSRTEITFSSFPSSGMVYLSVTSGDNGKGAQNGYYTVDFAAGKFPWEVPSANVSFDTATAMAFDKGAATAADWVGAEDVVDYFAFEIANAGAYNCALDFDNDNMNTADFRLTFYDDARNVIEPNLFDLAEGAYFVTVELLNTGKKSSYTLEMVAL